MLQQAPFGFDLIKKYVVLFGSTFDNIQIDRMASNSVSEQIKVPISYSAKDKMLAVLSSDPDKDRPYSALLPRIGFNMVGMSYDTRRKGPASNYLRSVANSTVSTVYKQFNFVPYNFDFELYIMSKNTSDANRIVEQVLPFFQPDFTSTVELVPKMSLILDIPIVLVDVSHEDLYDGDLKIRRTLIWTMKFLMKGVLCGPIYTPAMIKFIETNFKPLPRGVGTIIEQMDVQVTLTANGKPTTNVAESIPYRQINITDDYGFGETIINFSGNVIISTDIRSMVFSEHKNSDYVPIISH